MHSNKFNPLLLLAFAGAALLLVNMRDNTLRPAAAETAPAPAATPAPAQPQPVQLQAAQTTGPRSVILPMEADGHYWADARVNNSKVRFLVDTGASLIALTKDDARRIGINTRAPIGTAQISTANGVIEAPIVMVKRVRVGNVEVTDLEAVVIEEGLSTSLLGMSFLSELKSWQSTPKGLILKQ